MLYLLRIDGTLKMCKIRMRVYRAKEDGFILIHPGIGKLFLALMKSCKAYTEKRKLTSNVGSLCGTTDEEGTKVCPLSLKNCRNVSLTFEAGHFCSPCVVSAMLKCRRDACVLHRKSF